MGRRRSNRNKKKKDNKNVVENLPDKRASSALSQDGGNKNNYCSSEVQKPLEVQLPNKNSVTSCKINKSHEPNPSENHIAKKDKSLTTENIVPSCKKNLNPGNKPTSINLDTEASKLAVEICNTSIKKPQNGNHFVYPQEISETDPRYELTVSCAHKNNTLQVRKINDSTSNFPIFFEKPQKGNDFMFKPWEVSESDVKDECPVNYAQDNMAGRSKPNSGYQNCVKRDYDKETFARSVIDDRDEEHSFARSVIDDSDEEYSNFYEPNFDNLSKSKSNKLPREKQFHKPPYKSNLLSEDIFASEASCSDYRNSSGKLTFNGKIVKDTISCSVHAYKNSKDSFSNIYHTWLPQRRDTIQKLKTLKSEVHNMQLSYNKSQETLREASFVSRREKNSDNQVVDFVASFAAFLSDATSGIVSVVQAFNVESYQNKFKEIMEQDAETTQQLYEARSHCVAEYHNIEEVMRKFHSDNLSSTISKISDSLEIGKYWEGMKKAYEKDNMPELLSVVGNFFDNACQSTKLQEVSDTVGRYIDDNPATLDAVKSAGRATYGAIDTFKLNRSQNRVLKGADFTANHLLMIDDTLEIQRLRSAIEEEDSPQCKLEAQIEEAIDHLLNELREVQNIYFELYENLGDNDSDNDNDLWPDEFGNSLYF